MNRSFLSSALALLTAAALLTGCGNTGSNPEISASEESGTVSDEPSASADKQPEIGSDLTIGVRSFTAHAGDRDVPVSVEIWNNPGYAAIGMQLIYDPLLKPITTNDKSEATEHPFAKCELGDAADGFMKSCLVGEENHLIAFGGMTTEDLKEDGVIYTVYFNIPDDVPAGHEFTFACVMDSLNTSKKEHLSVKTVDGTLTIE